MKKSSAALKMLQVRGELNDRPYYGWPDLSLPHILNPWRTLVDQDSANSLQQGIFYKPSLAIPNQILGVSFAVGVFGCNGPKLSDLKFRSIRSL